MAVPSGLVRRLRPVRAAVAAGAALALVAGLWPLGAPVSAQQDTAPRLLVIVVVDQMRADYLSRFENRWRGGFRTLLDEGAAYERAAYPYMNTVTCAGHTTVGTGAFPHTHGMVLNSWWHREEAETFACMDDADSPDLSYGRPVTSADGPKRLLVNTLSDELRAQQPGARVVSLSLKARAAIALAGHGGDAVTWFDAGAGAFETSPAFTTERVPVIRDFIARDDFEQDLGRTWTLRDPAATYRAPDAGIGERPPAGRDGLFPHAVDGRNGADRQFFALWSQSPWSDAYLERMAVATVDGLELGQRDAVDFLAVGFSALDYVGHAYGPDSREVEDLLLRLDDTLGLLIEHLDATIGRDRYVLALTGDHGVAPIPEPGVAAIMNVDDVEDHIEDVLEREWGARPEGPYVDAISSTDVYFADGVAQRLREQPSVAREVEGAVLGVPGVARVLWAGDLSDSSSDPFVRAAALSFVPSRSGDLLLVPEPYWIAGGRNTPATGSTHGTAQWYDRDVPLALLGGPVRPGRRVEAATPADIAPTLADLAGIRLPDAEGRVLRESLR